ncbi:MAG: hypothetical protein HC852_11175 [Acaryochloridaceae cyanobacterium RU_4_10]|nr:hypothetical protein [Acaryochloridaceae cyanobacterium RU_4_10]
MSPQIIYTTRKPKPQPTPAPTQATAPAPDRISLGWGHSGRLHLNRSKAPESDRTQPRREIGEMSRSIPLGTPRTRVERVDRYSRLERIRRPKPLWEELAERSHGSRALEYLAIHEDGGEYAIAQRTTGEILVGQTFETQQFCADAAVELEQVFDMAIVLELRPPETVALIEDLVEWHYLREWVALGLVQTG